MKALAIKTFADQPIFALTDLPEPKPEHGEIRVKVKAVGVNQADVLQAKGKYPPPTGYPQEIPGLEFAGIVDGIGIGLEKFKIGDKVFGLIAGGAYCEQIIVNERCASKIPENMDFVEAASIPEIFITAYDALISQMNLSMGECLLVNAVGSGVGLAAVQIAKHIGVKVIGTSRSQKKLEQAEAFAIDHKILAKEGKFAEQVKEFYSQGPDVILELVGGNYLNEDIECIAHKGRISLVGLLAGQTVNVDLGKVLRKRLLIKGTSLRFRPLEEKILVNEILEKHICPLFQNGKLRTVIDKVFSFEDGAAAIKYLDNGKVFGKIVLNYE